MGRHKKSLRGQGSLELRGDIWHYSFYVAGRRHRGTTNLTDKKEAIQFLQRELGRIATLAHKGESFAPEKITVGALFRILLDDMEMRKPDAGHTKISVFKINRHLDPFFGSIRAGALQSQQITDYIKRRQKSAKNATINRELSLLHKAFSLGLKAEPPLVNRIPNITKLSEENTRTGFLRPDQYRALRDALVGPLKLLFVFAYHLGMRKGELLKIRKDQVDRKAKLIWLEGRQTKNKQPRLAPIYGEMGAFLDLHAESKSSLLFTWLDGSPIKDFRESWKQATQLAGVPLLLFHDLRRTAVRNMRQAGVDVEMIKRIIGHKTTAMFSRYAITDEQEYRDAGSKIEAFLEMQHQEPEAPVKVQ